MSDWSFGQICDKGVKEHSPQYYDQTQAYMANLAVNDCIFTGMNKNTSDIYTEVIPFDNQRAKTLAWKTYMLNLYADHKRIHPIPPYYKGWKVWQCRFCDYVAHCKEVG